MHSRTNCLVFSTLFTHFMGFIPKSKKCNISGITSVMNFCCSYFLNVRVNQGFVLIKVIVLDIAVQQVCLENSSNSYVRKGKISPECHGCYVMSVTELQTVVPIFLETVLDKVCISYMLTLLWALH